ncbi:MAG TPA: hypothetical protein VM243_04030, partial [Phycisphaerae bacterium]|nr:hypothetical protein [Phycisphaerae bacterium]
MEEKNARQQFRRGRQSVYVRVYNVPMDRTQTLPRAGDYFPGEISGPRIAPGGVSTARVQVKGGVSGLRITISATKPAYEKYVVVLKTSVPTADCRGFYSPDGTVSDSVE